MSKMSCNRTSLVRASVVVGMLLIFVSSEAVFASPSRVRTASPSNTSFPPRSAPSLSQNAASSSFNNASSPAQALQDLGAPPEMIQKELECIARGGMTRVPGTPNDQFFQERLFEQNNLPYQGPRGNGKNRFIPPSNPGAGPGYQNFSRRSAIQRTSMRRVTNSSDPLIVQQRRVVSQEMNDDGTITIITKPTGVYHGCDTAAGKCSRRLARKGGALSRLSREYAAAQSRTVCTGVPGTAIFECYPLKNKMSFSNSNFEGVGRARLARDPAPGDILVSPQIASGISKSLNNITAPFNSFPTANSLVSVPNGVGKEIGTVQQLLPQIASSVDVPQIKGIDFSQFDTVAPFGELNGFEGLNALTQAVQINNQQLANVLDGGITQSEKVLAQTLAERNQTLIDKLGYARALNREDGGETLDKLLDDAQKAAKEVQKQIDEATPKNTEEEEEEIEEAKEEDEKAIQEIEPQYCYFKAGGPGSGPGGGGPGQKAMEIAQLVMGIVGAATGGQGKDKDKDNDPSDSDGDGIPSESDNCPDVFNESQIDRDGDDVGDSCDSLTDSDDDGIADDQDNCVAVKK